MYVKKIVMQIFSYNEIKRIIILLLQPCADIIPEKKHNRRIKDTFVSEIVVLASGFKKKKMKSEISIYSSSKYECNSIHVYTINILFYNSIHGYTINILFYNSIHVYTNNILFYNSIHVYTINILFYNYTYSGVCFEKWLFICSELGKGPRSEAGKSLQSC